MSGGAPGAGPVVLALDGSLPAARALVPAQAIAAHLGAVLRVLHVAGQPLPEREGVRRTGVAAAELHGTVVEGRVGDPAAAIPRALREVGARLAVLSTRSGVPAARVLGPVAEQVLAEAACPVVFVRPVGGRPSGRVGRLLVPLDGTPRTAAALPAARDLCRAGVTLDVLHVAAAAPEPEAEPGALPVPRYLDQPQHEWPAWIREFDERFCRALGDLGCVLRLHLGRGDPALAIGEHATRLAADVIVLVWRGHLERGHADVVRGVLATAPCAVLAVRG